MSRYPTGLSRTLARSTARTSYLLATAAIVLFAEVARAQSRRADTLSTDSARTLSRVVVSATRTQRAVTDVPVSVTIQSGAEVRATPAQSMDDVVRTVGGVNVPLENSVVAHPTSNFISMRGLGGIRTLVLLDGVPVNDPFFGYVQWNKVPMELVDHVEIVRGGSSSLYGTYALGGVMNIISRRPTEDELRVEGSYGTNTTWRGNVLGSRGFGDAARLTVDANAFGTNGYVRPFGPQVGPIDVAGYSEAQNVVARLDLTPNDRTESFLRANVYRFVQHEGSPLGRAGHRAVDLAGGVRRRLGAAGSVDVRAFYEHDRPWTENTDPITARGVDEFLSNIHQTPTNDIGISAVWSQPFTSMRSVLTAGIDARSITGEDRADIYSAPGTFAFQEIGGGTQTMLGVFAQDEWFATDKIELLASARLDVWQNLNAHHDRYPGAKESFPDKTRSQVSPKLAFRYRLADPLSFRAAVYTAFNAPNLDQLYRPFSAQSYANVPNPALGAERLLGGELGLAYAVGGTSFQANVFQTTLRDVITYSAIAFDPVYTTFPVNLGEARSRGAELFAEWEGATGLRANGSYTFTSSIITDNPPDTSVVGKMNPDTPKHTVAVSVGYEGKGQRSFFLRGRYLSGRFTDASNGRALGEHFVLDASASVPAGRDMEVFVQAQNLLDRLYVSSWYGFDARGTPRQIFVGARATLRAKR